jgi:hypothetical protein
VAAGDLRLKDHIVVATGVEELIGIDRAGESGPVYNLTVAETHTYTVGFAGLLVHNKAAAATRTKKGGAITEPVLPPGLVAEDGDVSIVHYYRGGDHGPPHLHVEGGGPSTKIGMNGKKIDKSPTPTAKQQEVIDANKRVIRAVVDKIGRWVRFNRE